MPVPASVKFHPSERLNVDSAFKIATRGHSDDRLKAAIARFVKRLEGRTVFTFAPGLAPDVAIEGTHTCTGGSIPSRMVPSWIRDPLP